MWTECNGLTPDRILFMGLGHSSNKGQAGQVYWAVSGSTVVSDYHRALGWN